MAGARSATEATPGGAAVPKPSSVGAPGEASRKLEALDDEMVSSPPLTVADNPAAHPTFTVRVVGKGQPMLLIPGLNCPGAVWDATVAHYQAQYRGHIISLAGFGGAAPTAVTDPLLPDVEDQLQA